MVMLQLSPEKVILASDVERSI